jgi:BlaI family penicillinase repressor
MFKDKILTPLEQKVMNILWDIEKGYVKDILDHWMESPKPAYNTVSTIVRILQDKGFVNHYAQGRNHEYFPTVSRDSYKGTFLKSAVQTVFSGSATSLISALIENDAIDPTELEQLKALINEKL